MTMDDSEFDDDEDAEEQEISSEGTVAVSASIELDNEWVEYYAQADLSMIDGVDSSLDDRFGEEGTAIV